ncbi:MAG: triphosphoribosyl-dephospho-CoA synthase [Promethearchaeota archaeon]
MSAKETIHFLTVKTTDDILRCITLASLLEVSGWPKPGNVHRTKDFEDTRFEHFLAGIAAIQPNFRKLFERVSQHSFIGDDDYKLIKLGQFFKNAAKMMMMWQKGGNVLIGHILILAPLATTAMLCIKSSKTSINNFKQVLHKTINNTSVDDALNLYEALRLCNPGGLGTVEKYDINNKNSPKNLKDDGINLKKIFELSKERDLISSEYSTDFNITLNEGLPYFLHTFNQFKDTNIATVNTFLHILALHPDSLIIRKSGIEPAKYVSNIASKILKKGGISSEEGLTLTINLDKELQKKKGKLNPGTTADIVAGILFSALIFGFRY